MAVFISGIRKVIIFLFCICLIPLNLCADGLSPEPGIYENSHQLIVITNGLPESKVWKTFNTFWYDGPHTFDEKAVHTSAIAQIGDDIFVDFCIRYGQGEDTSGIWLPGGNCRDLSIYGGNGTTAVKDRLSGYYITKDGQIWQIPFWKVDADDNPDEIAILTIHDENSENGIVEVRLQKKIRIGGTVYTCTNGRSTRIRNPDKLDSCLLQKARVSSDGLVLSFSDPLYTRSSIELEQLDELVEQKNTAVYPPRFLWIPPQEPSIYRVLEEMEPRLD